MTDTDTAIPDVIPQRYEEAVPLARLTPHPANPNEGDSGLIADLIGANGFAAPILAQESTGIIIDGEHRRAAALARGMASAPVVWLDVDDDTRDRLLASLNESTRSGRNDEAKLVALLTGLAGTARGLAGTAYTGEDLDDLIARLNMPPLPPEDPDAGGGAAAQSLASRFLVPPFSVLDARQGYWQERKRAWLSLGIRSEEGRPRNLLKMSDTIMDAQAGHPNRSQPGGISPDTIKEMRHRDGDRRGETRRVGMRDTPNRSRAATRSGGALDAEYMRRKTRLEVELGRKLSAEEFERIAAERDAAGDRIPAMRHRRDLTGAERQAQTPRDTLPGSASRGSVPASHSGNDPQFYYKKTLAEREAGRDLTTEEFVADWYEGPDSYTNGTSVFDPVLAELVYRWFCPAGGAVLDPFAGGSVRGVVAGRLGLDYTGIDLRPEQVLANYEQAAEIGPGRDGREPAWEPGDARDITASWPREGQQFDVVFSCPPYFDLEQYGDDIADLSNARDYATFRASYEEIIGRACARLADDRFACFVVGEIRDPKGIYRGFVPDTIAAFEQAGLTFYNEAILITSVGSLALRAARIFNGGRKLGKAHQNVMVFCKGDPFRAADACGTLDLPDPAEFFATLGIEENELDDGDSGGVPGGDHRRGGLHSPSPVGAGDPDRQHGSGDHSRGHDLLRDAQPGGAGEADAGPSAEASGVGGHDLRAVGTEQGGRSAADPLGAEGGPTSGDAGVVYPAYGERQVQRQSAGGPGKGAASVGTATGGIDLAGDRGGGRAHGPGRVPRSSESGSRDGDLSPADLTPVEFHGGIWYKRDDAFVRHGSAGGKVRSCLALASAPGVQGLVTASDRESPQVNIVAGVAAALGLPCRVHVPAADQAPTPELAEAIAAGAEIVGQRPGFNTVIVARAAADARERGWVNVPFGMECPEAVEQTSGQAANLPAGIARVVIPVGSGMSLAGVLAGLERFGHGSVPVLGVVVGADPEERLDRYAPGWRDRVTLVRPVLKYHQRPPDTTFDGISLDPIYEAKCVPYLREGDLFWIIGCRQTARPGYGPAAENGGRAAENGATPDSSTPATPADLPGPAPVEEAAAPESATGPAWAKGRPLERLRQARDLWKAHDGDRPLGAFTAVKENQVADWADRRQFRGWATPAGELVAAAVLTASKGQAIEDFRGQVIARPQPGDPIVTRFAGNPQILAAELDQRRLWLWCWMENPADRWLAGELGLTWAGTKIRASSELIGLFGPEGDPLTGIDAAGLCQMRVAYDPAALWAEVQAAAPQWQSHYASYNQRGTWQAVSLRGYGGRPDFISKPAEMSRKWKADHPDEMGWAIKDTPLYGPLPQVRAVIDAIPGAKHRVRLMRLAPGDGELTRHSDITDPDAGTADGQLMRLHLPLLTNPGVIFRSWTPAGAQQAVNMAAGQCWYLDTRKPHTAKNGGDTERVHIVADVESSPALRALVIGAALETGPDLAYDPPPAPEWQEWTP